MGGCQNYGPSLDPYYYTSPNIWGTQKGTILLTTTHMMTVLHFYFVFSAVLLLLHLRPQGYQHSMLLTKGFPKLGVLTLLGVPIIRTIVY